MLARSVPSGRGEDRIFTRTYPTGGLFSHPIGYSYIRNGRISLERSRNDALAGEEDEFESIFTGLEGREREGLDVVTNLSVPGTAGGAWRRSAAARARSWRSSRRPARSA